MSKELARALIKEESSKIDSIIKESYGKKKSIKEMFLKKVESGGGSSYMNSKFLKDPLI